MSTSPEEKGFNRTLRKQGRDLKLLSAGPDSGKTFRGTINRIGAYDLQTDLANDPRGKRILEIPASGALALNDQNKIQDLKTGETFQLLTIGLDSPAYSKKFLMQQLTDKDQ